ncbi:MAG: DNA-binding NtrC family response regulator [Planctomycetota bacterium]
MEADLFLSGIDLPVKAVVLLPDKGETMILICDADGKVRDPLAQSLRADQLTVHAVGEARQALSIIANKEVDVLISEVHLPDMKAWELVPQALRLDPYLPIITATSDDSWETSQRMRIGNFSVFYYALKPIDPAEMALVVGCAIDWRHRQEQKHSARRNRRDIISGHSPASRPERTT